MNVRNGWYGNDVIQDNIPLNTLCNIRVFFYCRNMKWEAQMLLYDQCNSRYIKKGITNVFFVVSKREPKTAYWKLKLNPFSRILEYAITKSLCDDLNKNLVNAAWLIAEDYLRWIKQYCKNTHTKKVYIMVPAEWYLHRHLMDVAQDLAKDDINIEWLPNTQMLISAETFQKKFPKPPIMETFYRWMRKENGILMNGDQPVWWKWNYDKENRGFSKTHKPSKHITFSNNYIKEAISFFDYTQEHIRDKSEHRDFPITRQDAKKLLDYFISHHLDSFGKLEDAMYTGDWFVYHSRVSTAINFWLLHPNEVVYAIQNADSAIQNKEGYIRQVLWWREYMFHRFWHYKESIYKENYHGYTTSLPRWFWQPDQSPVQMHCLNSVLKQVYSTWYSHHITRLMIIWNFCQLAWFNPHDVNKWFREMYADAFEWVVTPNVLWMSQFADWWKLATKPYVSSANYINSMSDYCKSCYYDPKEKYWEKACPFNFLYWNFIDKNKELFIKWRQPFIVNNLVKIDIQIIKDKVKNFITQL